MDIPDILTLLNTFYKEFGLTITLMIIAVISFFKTKETRGWFFSFWKAKKDEVTETALKALKGISKNMTKQSGTLEKFSANVAQNAELLKDMLNTQFNEVFSKIDHLPSTEFMKKELDEVKKKMNHIHEVINDFIEIHKNKK
jgi:hypothetical protein